MCEPECRHELFDIARRRAELTVPQLWVQYLALGGVMDQFAIDAYLSGVALLPLDQQDVLANAVNERLDDLCQAAKVPYLHTSTDNQEPAYENPVEVLDELLGRTPDSDPVPPSPVELHPRQNRGPMRGAADG